MPSLSSVDLGVSPPRVTIPREYNAAHDLIGRNLAAGRGERVAFIDDKGSYTYGEVDRRSAAFANLLRELGIGMEQRILLCLHDTIDFPIAFLGAIRAGVVPVAVNTLLKPADYEYMVADSRARIAVVSAPLLPHFQPLRGKLPLVERILVSGADAGEDSLAASLSRASQKFDAAPTTSDDPCFWLYSSGSTGPPKGTVHVHSSMIQTAELYARPVLGIEDKDVVFSAAKLFFAYGLGNALSFPMSVGATAVLMAERPTPAAVFARLRTYRPSIFYGVPTLYAAMLASAELPRRDEFSLRCCVSAGEPLPEEIGKRWARHFGVDILDGIGSTEMLHIFLSNFPDAVKYGTTGKPVPGYDIRLLDDDGHVIGSSGEIGELQVRGPTSAIMYWNNREMTRETFLGEWTRSGDKYVRDEAGCYVYCGRRDDMLKVGGIYVSPFEVEGALCTHSEVLEAAVVAWPDEENLIKPKAYVVLKSAEKACDELALALQTHVKTALAPYKYPRWIEFRSDLPKTATGKIQRFKLRAESPAR
jgi:benzoate-CoA ligase